jgi:hypothetical protein
MKGSALEENMSELDRMISRLVTQRACLDHAADALADVPGAVLEVGLGKARTFDHLRGAFPGRDLYAFDFEVHAPKRLVPDAASLFLGDFRETLVRAHRELGRCAALVHADIGSRDRAADAMLAAEVAPMIAALTVTGGMVLTDREMDVGWEALALPDGVSGDWPYFMYRLR